MRSVKVLIILIVLGFLAYIVIESIIPVYEPDEIQGQINHSGRLQDKIDSVQLSSDKEFCVDLYKEISFDIDDCFRSHRLGETDDLNEQSRTNLNKQLYFTYTNKFINQAFYVFSGPNWSDASLQIIRDETLYLQESDFLQRNTPIDISLNEIRAVLNKYDEISAFIKECRLFNPTANAIEDTFPTEEVKAKISRAQAYLKNSMENSYVNNCVTLKTDLQSVPAVLFGAHCNYLESKVMKWSGEYTRIIKRSIYQDSVWIPLKNQIEVLESSGYQVADANQKYEMIKLKWEAQMMDAANYYNNPIR